MFVRVRGEREMPPLGGMQIARALILSHAGKKPLARYRVPCVTVAPDHGVGQVCATRCPATEKPRAPMSPRCDALRLTRCPQDDSGFLKYSRLGASHDCRASRREKLVEMAALDA